MRPSRRRRRKLRAARFESVEPRLFLSADPVGEPALDYFVQGQFHEEVNTSLVDAHELTGLDQVRNDYGFAGEGQTVVLIDTGIAYNHPALGAGLGSEFRVVGGFDFAERDADPYDDGPFGSHGTHVAGILGSNDANYPGVAPAVDLVALRVFDDNGIGDLSLLEEALQWVHAHRDDFENPITTVNISLGTDWNSDVLPSWANLDDELALLEDDGIFIAVAAGNSFTTYGEPGLSYPAVSPHVVPVASVDGDGGLSYFSQRSERVIAAPGRSVRSTVPDYRGNQNGIDDDWARFSGTSMAAPYVAGASVLIRQAYAFAGLNEIGQDDIYGVMVDTADSVYDPATGQDYNRLNLGRAIDSIMPEDDFGSTWQTAFDLGTIADTYSQSGVIGRLQDHDWFTFTASVTGELSVELEATGDLLTEWILVDATSGASEGPDNLLTFDVVAGGSYTLGLAAEDGLGYYTLDLSLEPSFGYTPWGTIAQEQFDDVAIDSHGQWFVFTAANDGLLTVEAFFTHFAGDVDLQLYDAEGQLAGASYGTTGSERIDVTAAAGDTFYLHAYTYSGGENDDVDFRVTNLVSQSGDSVRVLGTDADDTFTFSAATNLQLDVNGVSYEFQVGEVRSVTFDGLGGTDSIVLVGSGADESAVLRAGSAELRGSEYLAIAENVEQVTVRSGGGSGRAEFHDSAGNDQFLATPTYALLSGDGFVNRAEGFSEVYAYATGGGSDVAKLFDSAGNDSFVARPDHAWLAGSGFFNRVEGFAAVHAYATAGGTDVAKLFDSAGNDTFVARPSYGVLTGAGFYNRAKYFEGVHAYATAGGIDTAKLYDSAGNDSFIATPRYGVLFGNGFYNRAKYFEGVHAYAVAGGTDTASLYDSAGDDRFVADSTSGVLYGDGFYNRAKFFEKLYADARSGGNDRAALSDSAADDHFQAVADRATLLADGAATWLYGFEHVRVRATRGGVDSAEVAAIDFVLRLEGDWE